MKRIDEYKSSTGEIEREHIKQIIPYEEPFLMIDKVLSLTKDSIIAIKQTAARDWYFKGHFTGFPIMPGALMVEGMGQAATLLLRYHLENHLEKDILAYKIKDAKFSQPTFPGDELRYEVSLVGKDDKGGLFQAKAFVGERRVAEATMMLAIVNRKEFRQHHSV